MLLLSNGSYVVGVGGEAVLCRGDGEVGSKQHHFWGSDCNTSVWDGVGLLFHIFPRSDSCS